MRPPIAGENSELVLSSLDDWAKMLDLFSKASGLMASLFLPSGERVLGPYGSTGVPRYLRSTGLLEEGKVLHGFEQEFVTAACREKNFDPREFNDAITVRAAPIRVQQNVIGVVVFGWVFTQFPDPVQCYELGQRLGQGEIPFWQAVSVESPMSSEKLDAFESMLSLLCNTLVQQLVHLDQANSSARLKDELLATVSHELKTPLTSILLRVQMLQENYVKPERMKGFLGSLEKSAKFQSRLIEDLLDAAKIITGKFLLEKAPTDLSEILRDAVENVRTQAEQKQLTLVTEGFSTAQELQADGSRLLQAFGNVLANAVKFTGSGGTVSLRLTENISSFVVQISDTGTGIEASFLPYLFNKFSQHKSKIGQDNAGLGLGLSLVKTIVELHQGSVEVESLGIGKGTTFEIFLPKTSAAPEHSPRP